MRPKPVILILLKHFASPKNQIDILDGAAIGNHVNVLDWAMTLSDNSLTLTKLMGLAVRNGSLDIVIYLHMRGVTYSKMIQDAAYFGQLEILQWMHNQNIIN